jgi:hypothetical protein
MDDNSSKKRTILLFVPLFFLAYACLGFIGFYDYFPYFSLPGSFFKGNTGLGVALNAITYTIFGFFVAKAVRKNQAPSSIAGGVGRIILGFVCFFVLLIALLYWLAVVNT